MGACPPGGSGSLPGPPANPPSHPSAEWSLMPLAPARPACLPPVQGIALASDRDYKVLGAAYPWVARRLLTNTTPELRSTLLALLYKDGVFNFKRMESLISQAVRPTGRPQPRRSPQAGQSEWRGAAAGAGACALALVLELAVDRGPAWVGAGP